MIGGKTVVLAVTGGIAAYKAAELVSTLKKLGANVRVCMTASAQEFISPLTLQTLSQNPVAVQWFEPPGKWEIEHISLAAAADVMLIAPATANIIGKIANGIADDIVTTTVMATKAKVVLAPAMNCNMYENPIVQQNIAKLDSLGYAFVAPAEGRLACGVNGKGRLAPVDDIVEAVIEHMMYQKDLSGKHIVVTAGPTQEKIDDVRYITNHSSGRMGYAIAKVARRRGADVTLISGKTSLPRPSGIAFVPVDSAQDMFEAVMAVKDQADVIIKAAAVGDFRVKQAAQGKLKKDRFPTLELEQNVDILAELGKNKTYKLVGFCMETQDLLEQAAAKLKRKNADFIVANDLTTEGAGFGSETNVAWILTPDGLVESLPKMSKEDLANEILNRIK